MNHLRSAGFVRTVVKAGLLDMGGMDASGSDKDYYRRQFV